ncbi:hypothetical protein MSPP1_001219 [Malassezia sp. CBS 17886]|nr:hypothetical protein MSPP1_001219 [Malassezia sp. CBS 17886]
MSSPVPAPSRSNRKLCWDSRDAYYACLTTHGILAPPGTDMSDTKGPLGRGQFAEGPHSAAERAASAAAERARDPCVRERDAYEGNCAQSWVDYFNKRRILDERQKRFYADAEERIRSRGAQ